MSARHQRLDGQVVDELDAVLLVVDEAQCDHLAHQYRHVQLEQRRIVGIWSL